MLKKEINSFRYAFQGIYELFKTQVHARFHFVVAVLVVIAGLYFDISTTEWIVIVLSIAIVWSAEGFNTAIEYVTDLASPNFHPLAGKAKDVAAGAVLLVVFGAVVVGFIIFLPKVLATWF